MKRWTVVTLILIGFVAMSNCHTKSTDSQANSAKDMQELTASVLIALELHNHQLQSIADYIKADVKLSGKQSKDTQTIGESLVALKQHLDQVYDRLRRIEARLEQIQRTLDQDKS